MANDATSFRGARAENFRQVFLNSGHFAEALTYFPANGGEPVPLVAIVTNEQIDRQDQGDVSGREDVLRVKFSTDPAAVDADGNPLGGVDEPERGDVICRTGLGDGPDKRYSFEGRVIAHTDHHWDLEFVRVELQRVGMAR